VALYEYVSEYSGRLRLYGLRHRHVNKIGENPQTHHDPGPAVGNTQNHGSCPRRPEHANTSTNTGWDYFRIAATLLAVTAYLAVHDGVGEEGMVSGGKFFPWSEVRSYDYQEQKNHVAVYFTVESQDEKKPDDYTTKELDFSNQDKEVLMKFLKLNLGRKYTRMKKK